MARKPAKTEEKPKRPKRRFWRICRIYFRRFRIAVWFLVLALLGGLIYVNQIGLPGFVKNPLLEKLRAQGIDLKFSRLRLRWYQGIVAEKVRFERTGESFSPQLTLEEVQVQLNRRALTKLQLQVDGLMLRHGRLVWPILETNQPIRQLSVENIQTELRLLPDDRWELDHFTATLAGVKIRLSGAVNNASSVREWKFARPKEPTPAGVWQRRLRYLADVLERTHFSAAPELSLDVRGDALDPQSFHVRMGLNTPDADTPWGKVTLGRFTARLVPATNQQVMRAELHLHAADAQTEWATTTNLQMTLDVTTVPGETNLVNGKLFLSTAGVRTKWGSATNAQFTSQWVHTLTNPVPLSGSGQLLCEAAETQWGRAKTIRLNGHLATAGNPPPGGHLARPDRHLAPTWSWWTNLEPYELDWDGRITELESAKLAAEEIVCSGHWREPELTITNLHACLYEGQLDARGLLDVATRKLGINFSSDVDPKKVYPLLTEGARRWLTQFSWEKAPDLSGEVSVVLPLWTNRNVNWRAEVQPTLRLQGQFKFDQGGAFRGVPVLTAQSHVSYSNMVWRLPDLFATRPEGQVEIFHRASDITKDFYWRVASTIDLKAIRPLLETNGQRGLDLFTFTEPPVIAAEVWGRWRAPERVGAKGRVGLTNFTFRGESVSSFQTALQYTNQFLQLTDPHAELGTQQLSAASVLADFTAQKIYLSNGVSTADPQVVTRAIGPKVGRTMEPYRFGQPPTVRVKGIIPINREEDADLHFTVSGGPFHWWKFNPARISGDVHWVGERLILSDVHSEFYGGNAAGSADFDFSSRMGTDFKFTVVANNANLRWLISALSDKTNNLEGMLSGSLVITNANSEQRQKLDGYGNLDLRDGLIWDIPVFGIFTPALNGISPGLGNSRASAAACTFIITNAVMRSDDLEIRSPAMRLAYRGTVDLQGQVNARVDAELLRDVWGVGPVVSTVLSPVTKMFEYRISGPLDKPKTEPVYFIPRIVQMPFHPFRSLKELLLEDTGPATTNAAPIIQQTP
jgi:hypothetical protein